MIESATENWIARMAALESEYLARIGLAGITIGNFRGCYPKAGTRETIVVTVASNAAEDRGSTLPSSHETLKARGNFLRWRWSDDEGGESLRYYDFRALAVAG